MIVAAAPGRQLAVLLPDLRAVERRRVMLDLGQTLARLHTITTPGVAQPGLDARWPDPAQARAAFIAERTEQCRRLPEAGFSVTEVESITELITISPDTPTVRDPVLCHGDLHSAHVFIDDQLSVSGIIDWGLWHGGSAIGELAALSHMYRPSDFGQLLDGYGPVLNDHSVLRHRLALSVIIQSVGHLAWHLSIGNTDGQRHYVEAMRSALTTLKPA